MSTELERVRDALADRYRLDREVGRGGMATVYLAHDLRHGRAVAVKVLMPDIALAFGAARFLREIAVTAQLDHPHILPLLDSGESAGVLYYVTPFVEGESLRDRLAREKQLPVRDALLIVREIADALQYAHDLGIIHRDVKPENILLAGGHARLADFGIARVAGANALAGALPTMAMTGAGVAIGTVAYMSPEQAAAEPAVDRRADIYSLAVVAYEMLAGQPPHTGATVDAVIARKLRESAPSLRIVRESVPPAVDDAIGKALARVPADRFSTAREFSQALEPAAAVAAPSAPRDAPARSAAPVRGDPAARRRYVIPAVAAAVVGAVLVWWIGQEAETRWLAAQLVRIEQALDVADFEAAYGLAREIERRSPDSRELAELWPRMSWQVTIPSEPAGATVYRQAYGDSSGTWEELGRTPLVDVRIPYGLSSLRFELEGHRTIHRALGGAHLNWAELPSGQPDMLLVGPDAYRLDTPDALPEDMVRVPGWTFTADGQTLEARDFFIGRYEVTNAEYKRFVDAGGYVRSDLWDAVVVDGRTVPWEAAMRRFVDRTGRPGPTSWEAGDYPDGQQDYPVTGVSWYEAAAYARFAGRELPTAVHWQEALANSMFPWLLPASNFGGQGPHPVAGSRAMTHVGAFDMTGNVREWTATAIGAERGIMGGGWNDPYYIAGTADTSALPSDRSASNGIRLAITQDPPAVAARLRPPLPVSTTASRDLEQLPVSDDVYAAYGRVFDYRRGPLNDAVDDVSRTRVWTRERVQFDAGYGAERMVLYLYLPTQGAGPFQTVVYWPGWDTFTLDDVDLYFAKQLDFIVKSGRAVAFPIYKGIFERRVGNLRSRPPFDTADYRDNTIDGVKDLRRTIDYLETRSDLDVKSLAFFGYSWGGVNGPIALAQEPRIRAAVIDIGLLPPMSSTPEVDPVNALPRVRQPTLMLSGEFDPMVPAANARRYFALLGVPPASKRHVMAIGGHFIPRDLLIRESLEWLDTHLGPTR